MTKPEDHIHISGFKGVSDYDDLQSHIESHKHDTWIDFGADVMIIKNIQPEEFGSQNFQFN